MTPSLSTEKYIVRKFHQVDLEAFAIYRANPEIARFQSWSDYSFNDAVALFEGTDYSTFGTSGNWYQLAITDKKSDRIIGDIAIHFIGENQPEIGFTIAPEHQGKSVAFEAASIILEYLFVELKKHRIIAVTDTLNIASVRLLEKLGFRREAHYIKNVFFKGAWGDEFLYAMLSEDYEQPNK
ncbi:MAG: GNAT family N-acetyltransferase [Bacteroidetes bacterium]|nr:GNAT family N-acetyltransferase [Bacteroidota bacterium]